MVCIVGRSTGFGCQSCSWSAEQEKCLFPCPRSRLRIRSRETGSAVPSRVSPLILHTQAESSIINLISLPGSHLHASHSPPTSSIFGHLWTSLATLWLSCSFLPAATMSGRIYSPPTKHINGPHGGLRSVGFHFIDPAAARRGDS